MHLCMLTHYVEGMKLYKKLTSQEAKLIPRSSLLKRGNEKFLPDSRSQITRLIFLAISTSPGGHEIKHLPFSSSATYPLIPISGICSVPTQTRREDLQGWFGYCSLLESSHYVCLFGTLKVVWHGCM